jgi:polyferredoxin
VFILAACLIGSWRRDFRYLLLFTGIGFLAGATEFLMARFPERAQLTRRTARFSIAAFLVSLALIIGVNFQFSGVFFDIYEGIVTGALIQFLVARLIIPFVLGNAFCSRVCWDGAFFEVFEKLSSKDTKPPAKPAFRYPAWILICCLGLATAALLCWFTPKLSPEQRAILFIIENALIITISFPLAGIFGKRAYCRMFCPFLAVSSVFSKFSLFKVTPVNADACSNCGLCDKACPMSIPVRRYVREGRRVSDANCMLCERCVSACPQNCIRISHNKPTRQ